MNSCKLLAMSLLSVLLIACGGGGGGGSVGSASGATGPAPVANAFDSVLGTYSTGCYSETYNTYTYSPPASPVVSGTVTTSYFKTIVLKNVTGADKATVVYSAKEYANNGTCAATALDFDVTVEAQLTSLGTTKAITGSIYGPKSGVAKIVEARYDSISLAKGILSGGLPAFGTKGKGGYLIEGDKLYLLKGARQADGVQSVFAKTVLTKQ
jgi:hypothetical protein